MRDGRKCGREELGWPSLCYESHDPGRVIEDNKSSGHREVSSVDSPHTNPLSPQPHNTLFPRMVSGLTKLDRPRQLYRHAEEGNTSQVAKKPTKKVEPSCSNKAEAVGSDTKKQQGKQPASTKVSVHGRKLSTSGQLTYLFFHVLFPAAIPSCTVANAQQSHPSIGPCEPICSGRDGTWSGQCDVERERLLRCIPHLS